MKDAQASEYTKKKGVSSYPGATSQNCLHHTISMKTAGLLFHFKWSFIAVPFLLKSNKTGFKIFLQMPKLVSPVHVSEPPVHQTASMVGQGLTISPDSPSHQQLCAIHECFEQCSGPGDLNQGRSLQKNEA